MPTRYDDVARSIQELVRKLRPRRVGLRIVIILDDGEKLPFALPAEVPAAPEVPAERQPFVPTPSQEAILAALDGKGMRTDALGHAIGDRNALFRRPGGIQELRDEGLVAHHKRVGYYRPDAPPPELEESV